MITENETFHFATNIMATKHTEVSWVNLLFYWVFFFCWLQSLWAADCSHNWQHIDMNLQQVIITMNNFLIQPEFWWPKLSIN